MAKNNKHTPDPAALTLRVWVIEWRIKGRDNWLLYTVDKKKSTTEWEICSECGMLPMAFPDREFRYRAATLTFDDDGSRATIY